MNNEYDRQQHIRYPQRLVHTRQVSTTTGAYSSGIHNDWCILVRDPQRLVHTRQVSTTTGAYSSGSALKSHLNFRVKCSRNF